jgi:hypothetical protein
MIKSVGDFISTQRTLCMILERLFARIFFCKLLCLSDGSMHVGYMIKYLTTYWCLTGTGVLGGGGMMAWMFAAIFFLVTLTTTNFGQQLTENNSLYP